MKVKGYIFTMENCSFFLSSTFPCCSTAQFRVFSPAKLTGNGYGKLYSTVIICLFGSYVFGLHHVCPVLL